MQNDEHVPNQVADKCTKCGRTLLAGERLYHSQMNKVGCICTGCSVRELEDVPRNG